MLTVRRLGTGRPAAPSLCAAAGHHPAVGKPRLQSAAGCAYSQRSCRGTAQVPAMAAHGTTWSLCSRAASAVSGPCRRLARSAQRTVGRAQSTHRSTPCTCRHQGSKGVQQAGVRHGRCDCHVPGMPRAAPARRPQRLVRRPGQRGGLLGRAWRRCAAAHVLRASWTSTLWLGAATVRSC